MIKWIFNVLGLKIVAISWKILEICFINQRYTYNFFVQISPRLEFYFLWTLCIAMKILYGIMLAYSRQNLFVLFYDFFFVFSLVLRIRSLSPLIYFFNIFHNVYHSLQLFFLFNRIFPCRFIILRILFNFFHLQI